MPYGVVRLWTCWYLPTTRIAAGLVCRSTRSLAPTCLPKRLSQDPPIAPTPSTGLMQHETVDALLLLQPTSLRRRESVEAGLGSFRNVGSMRCQAQYHSVLVLPSKTSD